MTGISTTNLLRCIATSALVVCLAACVSQASRVQDKEQMLVAAGFLEKPASTPQRQAHLASLPPFSVLSQQLQVGGVDTIGYVYADPQFCHCLFVGDPAAYQRFQQMALQQRIAQEQIQATEMAEDNAFDWGMWGPYDYWGGGDIIGGHGGHGGFGGHGHR
jgi:hypothetical protein